MEVQKSLELDTWQELEALQSETRALLNEIKGKNKSDKSGKEKGKDGGKTAIKSSSSNSKGRKAGKRNALEEKQLSRGVMSTQHRFNDTRMTVEVLDDASPDGTPRIDPDANALNRMERDKETFRNIQQSEISFRTMQFAQEINRVQSKSDTFVSKPGVTREDVEQERKRLAYLEETAVRKRNKMLHEIRGKKEYLQQDRSAIEIQRVFRGRVGRRKYNLTQTLQQLNASDGGSGGGADGDDWIEVSDPTSGDTWYYNKKTNVSQWKIPDSVAKKLKRKAQQRDRGGGPLSAGAAHQSMSPAGKKGKSIESKRERALAVSMSLPSAEALRLGKRSIPIGSSMPPPPSNDGEGRSGYGNEMGMSGKSSGKFKELSFHIDTQFLGKCEEDGEDAQEEHRARDEVRELMGLNNFEPEGRLLAPDGKFKPQLRNTVLDALLDTRFDSVSTVLADKRWMDNDEDPFLAKSSSSKSAKKQAAATKDAKFDKVDPFRPPMVAMLNIKKKKAPIGQKLVAIDHAESGGVVASSSNSPTVREVRDLTFKEIEHAGFDVSTDETKMCFGCWSAGAQHRKCALHSSDMPLKTSQTMLLCRNWDLEVMRRRYRSEEIQEIYNTKGTSLRYDVKFNKFFTVVEKRHPIYRAVAFSIDKFNARMMLFEKVKRWIMSVPDYVRTNRIDEDLSRLMSADRSVSSISKVRVFTKTRAHLLPVGPTTGYSWAERTGQDQVLFQERDTASAQEVDLIKVYPIPVPLELYKPRVYHMSVPKSIPMPKTTYGLEALRDALPGNEFIDTMHAGAWFERMASAVARDAVSAAKMQVNAVTPVTQTNLVERTKKSTPTTIKFATTAQKPTPGFLAVGGLAKELLINQLVSTYINAQYGSFMVMEKSTVSPGVSLEETIAFESIVMPPSILHHIIRQLEHPLNYRRVPTITLNSHVGADEPHYYGLNRPEQTGEQESHGFRTTTWAPMLLTYLETDPQVFIPGEGVVSLNVPKANVSSTTHADHTYPFCEPSTRDNSTLDFYHLLLAGVVSHAKAQIFTALTVQEPGKFYKDCRSDYPMGHLVVSVYRSWAFTQKDTIQEFKTDDGVSYWYHRITGQTFWERPLDEDEEPSVLRGGTILDQVHSEEPSTIHKGEEGATRRYSQGDFRKQMLMHIETKSDALKRRHNATSTVHTAKLKGQIPDNEGAMSVMVHPQTSAELGSHFDFSRGGNPSIMPNSDGSLYTQEMIPTTADDVRGIASPMPDDVSEYGEVVQDQDSNLNQNQQLLLQNGTGLGMSAGGGGGAGPRNQLEGANPYSAFFTSHDPTASLQGSGNMQGEGASGRLPQEQEAAMAMFPGFDPQLMANLTNTIGSMFTRMNNMESTSSQDMIQLGLGMGMALMTTAAMQGAVPDNSMQLMEGRTHTGMGGTGQFSTGQFGTREAGGSMFSGSGNRSNMSKSGGGAGTMHIEVIGSRQASRTGTGIAGDGYPEDGQFPVIPEEASTMMSLLSGDQSNKSPLVRTSTATPVSMRRGVSRVPEPIGKPDPTIVFSSNKDLDHAEERRQVEDAAQRLEEPLSSMERVRLLKIQQNASTPPDEIPHKVLTIVSPLNADDAVKEVAPVFAYPELATQYPGGAPPTYVRRPPAGEGSSFVPRHQAETQKFVEKSGGLLRRTVMPLPVGFFEAIEAKHLAKQEVDYLPQVPNLPQTRTIGRVKPRSAAADWLMIKFDPWSAGKNPLNAEFVPSLMGKADQLFGQGAQAESMENLRQKATEGAYVTVHDEVGLAAQRAEVSKQQQLAEDFQRICSLCRNGKFADAEQLINQPDWSVPIDFQDDQGNSLLHVVAQNGNKRLVKLCLRRGAALNLQNLTGQTPLHFAFSYGYEEVGHYLVNKGADDSICNKDGLTCYEGLGAKELSLL